MMTNDLMTTMSTMTTMSMMMMMMMIMMVRRRYLAALLTWTLPMNVSQVIQSSGEVSMEATSADLPTKEVEGNVISPIDDAAADKHRDGESQKKEALLSDSMIPPVIGDGEPQLSRGKGGTAIVVPFRDLHPEQNRAHHLQTFINRIPK